MVTKIMAKEHESWDEFCCEVAFSFAGESAAGKHSIARSVLRKMGFDHKRIEASIEYFKSHSASDDYEILEKIDEFQGSYIADEGAGEEEYGEEEKEIELITEIKHYLHSGYYEGDIGDELAEGLDYIVKNIEELQKLGQPSQIRLVRMGYEQLAEDMGSFSHALYSIAERGTTTFEGPSPSRISETNNKLKGV